MDIYKKRDKNLFFEDLNELLLSFTIFPATFLWDSRLMTSLGIPRDIQEIKLSASLWDQHMFHTLYRFWENYKPFLFLSYFYLIKTLRSQFNKHLLHNSVMTHPFMYRHIRLQNNFALPLIKQQCQNVLLKPVHQQTEAHCSLVQL